MPDLSHVQWVWPVLLWGLLLPPLLLALRLWQQRRQAQRPSSWGQMPVGTWGWGVSLLLLLGLTLLVLALARPRVVVLAPSRLDTVMLVVDSSGSMRADDLKPSRLAAAQEALQRFVAAQPSKVKLGVVSVAATAALVQPPTDEREPVLRAIEQLSLQPGTALGSGLVIALDAALPASGLDVRKLIEDAPDRQAADKGQPLPGAPKGTGGEAVRQTPGSQRSVALVLLSDGQSNVGPDVQRMAQLAADLGVRVHTVGLGTPQGVVLKAQGMSVRVKLDEGALKQIADTTRGEYFRAEDSATLARVYDQLSRRVAWRQQQQTEVSALLGALGMALVLLATGLNWWRRGRIA